MALTEAEELELLRLKQRRAAQPQAQGALASIPRGFNTGVANVLGFPVDVANMALAGVDRVAGTQLSGDEPVMGSRFLKRALRGFDRVPQLSNVTYDQLSDLAPSDRKFAVAGETLGGSLVPAAAPYLMARGAIATPRMMQPVVDAARRSPGAFGATEAGLAAGSAQGAMIAEHVAPGSEGARFVGEVAGGIANPTAVVRGAVNLGSGPVRQVYNAFSPAGRERAAAEIVQGVLRQSGEDTDAVINALRASDPFKLDLTSGQRTGSQGLLAIERRLAGDSPQFQASMEAKPEEAFNFLRANAEAVAASGQPQALVRGAEQRVGRTVGLARTREQMAREAAARARAPISDVTRPQMAQAGVEARQALESAKQSAKGTERAKWENVPRNVTIEPENVIAARETIRGRLLPNEAMPQPVETFTKSLAREADQPVDIGVLDAAGRPITREGAAEATSGDLLRLRSRALTMARDARARGDFDLANQMDLIASGALDDLGNISDEARSYTRELSQRFRQGFAGDVLARDATGGPRIEPEQTLERAFGTGGTPADVRMRQLTEATDFGGQGQAMLSQQDTFLRGAARNMINEGTGRVDPNRLARFRRENAALLERFPQLRNDLASAESAERAFARVEAIAERATDRANRSLLAQFVGPNVNPTAAIGDIINPARGDRVQRFGTLARSVQKAGPEAVAGLRSATLENVFRQATDQTGAFNFERLAQSLLYKGPSGRDPNLLEMMRSTNVLDAAADQRLRQIVDRAARLQRALDTPAGMDKLVPEADALSNFVTRVIGARIGAQAGSGSGTTLVTAYAGSKLLRNFMEKIPANKTQDILIEAANNPRFMAMLLEKPTSVKQARELTRQMNAYLVNAGIVATQPEEESPLQQSMEAYGR